MVENRRGIGVVLGLVLVLTLLTACAGSSTSDTANGSADTTKARDPATTTTGKEPVTTTGNDSTTAPSDCASPTGGVPWREDETVTLEQIGSDNGHDIYAAEYPLPGPTDGLWTQWGQATVLEDGTQISAVGNHLGVGGNSWFFTYEPATRRLTRFGDVVTAAPDGSDDGSWGYGKVHAQMRVDRCGAVWAATYWGTRRDLVYDDVYQGDRLLQIDPVSHTILDHGAIAGQRGMPTMVITGDGTTLVATSVDAESDTATFTVFDTVTGEVTHQVDDPEQALFRALGIDPADGNVLYATGGGHLGSLDPATGEFTDSGIEMPGAELRAITSISSNGTVYGVTDEESAIFSFGADHVVEHLGSADGYTASLAMTPDGGRIFWLPDAHGGAWQSGAVVREMDTSTGEVREVASLKGPFDDSLRLLPGGTYSIVYDQGRLILGVNASTLDDDSGFGTVVLVVIEGV
ncbi:MAG: hypothetical protein WAN34_03470 [Acidimicrobiia bacterium]